MKIESTRVEYVKRLAAILFLTLTFALGYGQTTYTWIGPTSGGSWGTSTNWSPARSALLATDILQFNGGATYNISGIPTTQTIRQLLITNSTTVNIQQTAASTLTISGVALTNNILIANGSTLSIGSTAGVMTLTMATANQRADISGTLTLNTNSSYIANAVASHLTTVSSTGVINHYGGTITSTTTTLNFAAGSNYNYLSPTTSIAIPTATWDAASNCNITGVTSGTALTGFSGAAAAGFGHFTYNCPGQTSATFSLANALASTTIKGDFNIISTGIGAVVIKSGTTASTLNVMGNVNITGGQLTLNTGTTAASTLTVAGDFNLSVGTFNMSTAAIACVLNIDGNYNHTGGTFTQTSTTISTVNFRGANKTYTQNGGTTTSTYINYSIGTAAASLTLANDITISAGRSFTISSGTLYCATNFVTGAGTFTLNSSALAGLGIGSPDGITLATPTPTGSIRTTGGRSFGVAANYYYTGTSNQATGTGLQTTINGANVYVMLANNTDALSFTNTTYANAITIHMVNGNVGNALTLSNAGTTISYEATYPQTTGPEFPASVGKLAINNATGVTLSGNHNLTGTTAGTLAFTNGVLTTSTTNLLTLTSNLAAATITGASATAYVNGPLARTTPSLTGATAFVFPIGKSTYQPVTVNPTTTIGGIIIAEVIEADAGGSAGVGVGTLNSDKHWRISAGNNNVTSLGNVSLTEGNLQANNYIMYASGATAAGTYNIAYSTIAGSVITTGVVIPASPTTTSSVYYVIGTPGTLSGVIQVGNSSSVQKLYQIANLLNTSTVTADVIFELQSDYDGTTGEIFPINFYSYTTSGGSWNATVRPALGVTGRVTSSNPGSGVNFIAFNGVDNLTFDGRPGGAGNSIEWIIRNAQTAATYTSTLLLINDATYNTIQYVQLESQNALASNGTVMIGGTTGTTGNDNNIIRFCNIRDRSDVNVGPRNAIYMAGASSKTNDNNVVTHNNIFNNWQISGLNAGVFVDDYNTNCRISNNSFYQTAARNTTTATSSVAVNAASTLINSITVDSNYIGGTAPQAGGTVWQHTSTSSSTFQGIRVTGSSSTGTSYIRNNYISKINWSCAFNTATLPGIFSGIYISNQDVYITDNTIGGSTGVDSIKVTTSSSGAAIYGIGISASSGQATISGNKIGAFTSAGSSTSVSVSIVAIQCGDANTRTITNNLIGSLTTPNSINASTAATGSTSTTSQTVLGINLPTGATIANVTGNTIANLRNAYVGSYSATPTVFVNTVGIWQQAGKSNIANNTIANLSSNGTLIGANKYTVAGIVTSATFADNTVSGNIIRNLKSGASSAAVNIAGLVYNGVASGTTTIEKNFIHSLSPAAANNAAVITGIFINDGNGAYKNNMIRLGIDDAGATILSGCSITGINKAINSASAVNRFYYNSVYVGGNPTSGANATYAFRRTLGTSADVLQNNIFVNARANSGAGTGIHYGIGFAASTAITAANCNYNFFDGVRIGQVGAGDYNTLALWRSGTGFDVNSYSGNPQFINPTGDANSVDLHINSTMPTQVEANAFSGTGVADDYDSDARTSPDIGADEGDFTPIDLSAPTVTYIPFANVCNDVTTHTVTVSISDASGVNTTSGLAPRIYYKKASDATNAYNSNTSSTAGWKYVESASTSSPFSFTIDFALINGGVNAGDAIQYVVVAQDMANPNPNNVGINSGTSTFSGTPATVGLASGGFPIGGTPNQFIILPCSGTVTVGTGGNYGVFTTANGIFNAINQTTLSGNLTIDVISDITTEDGFVGLNQWAESGLGGYTITIQSATNMLRTISGNSGANAGLFRMNGADRVIFNGGTGSNQFLKFRNTSIGAVASTFNFLNDATNITVNNCILEGGAVSGTCGVVLFGGSASGSGNDNITITACDIKDGVGLPTNGIYAAGTTTAGRENSNVNISYCNIYNFFTPTILSSGISLFTGNTGWSINNNTFYQTATCTTTAALVHAVIRINNAAGGGFTINNNLIGGNNNSATGLMTYFSATSPQIAVLHLNMAATPVNNVQNNTIRNISFTTTSGATNAQGIFSGIYVASGAANIQYNTIGSATDTGSIKVIASANVNGALVAGIKTDATGGISNVSGNTVAGISVSTTGTSNSAMHLYGVHANSSTTTISNNIIGGGGTVANSLQVMGSAIGNASTVTGVFLTSAGGLFPQISSNQIRNLTNNNTGSSTTVVGINASTGGIFTINGNTVANLTGGGSGTGVGTSSSALGISLNSGGTMAHNITGNTVHSLTNAHPSASAVVTGIYYSGSNTISNVNKNLVYNLKSTDGPASVVNGLHLATTVIASNNMIRLGYSASGADIATTSIISGIYKDANVASRIFHNSIYIGGVCSGSATTSHSYAIQRRIASVTTIDSIRNNILVNERSGGSSKHYAIWTTNATTISSNYNLFYAPATNGVALSVAGTIDYLTQSNWSTATGHDANSFIYTPNFVSPTSVVPDLHLASPTLAESNGVNITYITDDFDSDIRALNTPVDIGADAANFVAVDIIKPAIAYTPLLSQAITGCGTVVTTLIVTITDAQSGLSLTSNKPRLYLRRAAGVTNPWGSFPAVEGALVSGNGNNGVWQFNIDYNAMGIALAVADKFEYYVVAQDQATTPNLAYSVQGAIAPVHSNVATVTTPPSGPLDSTSYYFINIPLSGTVTVGTGGTYPTFNGLSGLFYALNSYGLSGNLTVSVISDVNESGLYTVLGPITEQCNGSGYTVLIQPNTATTKIVYQVSGGNPMINMAGCKQVTFDGSFGGSGNYLLFRQQQSMPTFYLNGHNTFATENIVIKNSTIEGNNLIYATGIGGGVINLASVQGTGLSIRNISIDNNVVRDRSDITPNYLNVPWYLICGGLKSATGLPLKSNISITNNRLFNFSESAIRLEQNSAQAGIGDSIIITGNSIYQAISIPSYQYPIWLEGATSKGNIIVNNKIGGNAAANPNITGTWVNNAVDGEVNAIYTLVGGTQAGEGVIISNNTISNISVLGLGYTNFIGIRNEYGAATITNNTIGSPTTLNSIYNLGNGGNINQNSGTIGIWNQDENECVISNNTIANMSAVYTSGYDPYHYVIGIAHGSNIVHNGTDYLNMPGGTVSITGNRVFKLNSASILYDGGSEPDALIGIFSFSANGTTGNDVSNNSVYGLNSTSGWLNAINNTRVYGIGIGLGGYGSTQSGAISNNILYDLNNNSRAAMPEVNGVVVGGGNWSVINNMITLTNSTYPSAGPILTGIYDWMLNGRIGHIYNNTVYIGGSISGTTNNSYAYCRQPDGLGTVSGANVTIRNNIFYNDRSSTAYNIAIANMSTNPAVGWSSNYNFLVARNASYIGRWVNGVGSFTSWQGLAGEANSKTATVAASSSATTVNAGQLFISTATGNLHINTAPSTAPHPFSFVRNAGTPIATVTADIDTDPRDPLAPDLGCDEFTDCSTPVISMTANGISGVSTTCSGSTVTLNVTSSGSGANCNGTFEFAISSGGFYWDGSAFTSSTPLYSSTNSSISFAPTSSSVYLATIACSADQTCRSNSNSATVNILGSVANVNAAIGTPANGTDHYITVSWPSVSNATGYDVDYSNNGSSWTNVASNLSATMFSHNTGDSPNVPTYYRVRPRNASVVCSYTAMVTPVYTACDAPELPLVNGVTTNSVNVTLQSETPVANPAYTTYSIFCTTTNQYVQADGSLGSNEFFQTSSQWGTITVIGLALNTSYCFYAKARNVDGDVRSGGNALIPVQQFNSNVFTQNGNLYNMWFAPDSYTPISYISTGGCSGGRAGYSGSFNNSWGNFIRTPEQNCTGMTSVVVSFDLSNSYFATQTDDYVRFYMWDNYYTSGNHYYRASSIKVNGVEASYIDINGIKLLFDQSRSCTHVEVTFDFNAVGYPLNHRDKTLFYLEPNCNYNSSNIFNVSFDNISISQTTPTACATTISCIAPAITTQPVVPTTVCASSGVATISVAATGTGLTYQWRKSGLNIAVGGVYSVNSTGSGSTLTITNPLTTDAGNYDVVVSGLCSPSVISNAVMLTVNTPISGLAVSSNSPICEGFDLSLSGSVVTGTGIAWAWSGPGFSASTQSPALIGINEAFNEGQYNLTASNVCNSVTTSTTVNVHRNIIGLVVITDNSQICQTDTLKLFATYTGLALPATDIVWSWSGSNGFTASTQNTIRTPVNNNDDGIYDVFATNACGVKNAASPNVIVDEFIEADAGPDGVTNVCGALTAQLQGNSSTAGTGVWSEISAGNTAFTPSNIDNNALITADAYGLKQYRWTIANGACVSEDDVRYFFNPAITATVDLAGCNFTNADSVFVNVTASGGSSTLSVSPPAGSELKLDISGTKVYTAAMDGAQRTYTISDGICNVSANVTSPMGHPTDIPYVSASGTITADCYDNGFTKWLTFRDVNNDAILSVYDNGQDLGKISASVYREAVEPVIAQASSGTCQGVEQLAMKRHFVLSSNAAQPFAIDVSVRLYFSEAELNDLVAATQANDISGDECTTYDNLTGLSDLFVTKYTGADEDGDYMNNSASGIYRVYTSGNGTLQPVSNGFPTMFANGQNHHYVELNMREFSELWLHGSSTGSALPVEMIYLNAEGVNNEYIKLTWATALEINNNGFVIERSIDAENWESIGWVDGHNNTTTQKDYAFNDHTVSHNIRYYYRLRQVDNDGAYEYTGLVSAIISATESVFTVKDVIPNPALNSTTLVVVSPAVQNIQLDVYNAIGQKIYGNVLGLVKGTNSTVLNVSDWAAGTYTAVVQFNNEVYSKKLVIAK